MRHPQDIGSIHYHDTHYAPEKPKSSGCGAVSSANKGYRWSDYESSAYTSLLWTPSGVYWICLPAKVVPRLQDTWFAIK